MNRWVNALYARFKRQLSILHRAMPGAARQLRHDIVVTEYGIADLRGKTDAQVIEPYGISASRFQCNCLNRRNGPARAVATAFLR
jgi:hypothetical protein